jgi:lipoprotein-releasing system permease protein
MLPLKIAARFLRMSPAQSVLIILGIAVGIAVQVFVGSLITSLQASLVNTTIGSAAHVTVQAPKDGDPVAYTDRIKSVVRQVPDLTAVVPSRVISALFVKDTDQVPLTIRGGDLADLDLLYKLSRRTVAGTASLRNGEIMVGKQLADKYGVLPGDRVNVVLSSGSRDALRVTGVFDLGSAAANARSAFTGPALPRTALGWRADQFSAVELQIADPFKSTSVANDLRGHFGADVKIGDWQVDNKDLLTALNSQSASSYMIQVFVLVAVALGIASTLAIAAVQKTKQIGILKALGMSDARTAAIFVWEAAILGVLGTSAGVGLGLLLIAGFTFGTSKSGSGFPINPQPGFIAISAGIGLLVAMLSSIIPTRKTARLDPIEVIQNG